MQAQAAATLAGTPVFRGTVDLVSLNVTLTNGHNQPVGGLTAGDFAIFEDGVQQDLSFFSSARLPMDVAILLDTSSSMSPVLSVAQDAAIGLVESAQHADRVSVTEFNDRANILHSLSSDMDGAIRAIRGTSPRGSTALYNGLYMAMTEMVRSRRKTQDVRKQAVVVLSDGQDTSSLVQYEDVMELANQSGIVLYTILLLSPFDARQLNDLKTSKFSQSLFVMRSFAEATGGVTFLTSNVRDLQGIYSKIATELAQQYTLGYMSTNAQAGRPVSPHRGESHRSPGRAHTNAQRISGAQTVGLDQPITLTASARPTASRGARWSLPQKHQDESEDAESSDHRRHGQHNRTRARDRRLHSPDAARPSDAGSR